MLSLSWPGYDSAGSNRCQGNLRDARSAAPKSAARALIRTADTSQPGSGRVQTDLLRRFRFFGLAQRASIDYIGGSNSTLQASLTVEEQRLQRDMVLPLDLLIQENSNIYELTRASIRRAYQISVTGDEELEQNQGKVVSTAIRQVLTRKVQYQIEE